MYYLLYAQGSFLRPAARKVDNGNGCVSVDSPVWRGRQPRSKTSKAEDGGAAKRNRKSEMENGAVFQERVV